MTEIFLRNEYHMHRKKPDQCLPFLNLGQAPMGSKGRLTMHRRCIAKLSRNWNVWEFVDEASGLRPTCVRTISVRNRRRGTLIAASYPSRRATVCAFIQIQLGGTDHE
jgi:hypothetical protein